MCQVFSQPLLSSNSMTGIVLIIHKAYIFFVYTISFTHPSDNEHLSSFTFWLLLIILLWVFMYTFYTDIHFPFFWIIYLETQGIHFVLHLPFHTHILIFAKMDLISNFITFCAHRLHSHCCAFRSKFSFIPPTSLFSDITPSHSSFPSLQKTLFPSSFNAQLLHQQLEFSLFYQAFHMPLEATLMWILISTHCLSLLLVLVHNYRLVIST